MLKENLHQILDKINWDNPEPAVETLSRAYLQKANLKNKLYQIELASIDPASRTALEKQQMLIAKENEEYRQTQMELELINAGIKALEMFLNIYEKNQQEVI